VSTSRPHDDRCARRFWRFYRVASAVAGLDSRMAGCRFCDGVWLASRGHSVCTRSPSAITHFITAVWRQSPYCSCGCIDQPVLLVGAELNAVLTKMRH